jgi:ubiquinone/menaquinone biosynthesis C-methylase UbiE
MTQQPGTSGQPAPQRVMQLMWGYATTMVLEAGVRLRYFDELAAEPGTAEELARRTGTSLRGARAVLNALVGLELLRKEGEQYLLGPEAEAFLVSDRPSFVGAMVRHASSRLIPSWLHLTEVAKTGHPPHAVNQEEIGAEFFAGFVEDIFPMSYGAARTLATELKVSASERALSVLDLAAGSGVWGIALAEASPQVSVTAVDWPAVLEVTRRVAARRGVGERLRTVAGDLLEVDFGGPHDIAVLGHILHSEGEERSRRLLARVHSALTPGGTVVIAEMVPNDERTGPQFPLLFAVNMLVHTEAGDVFTFAEMSEWLRAAGFTDVRQVEAPSPSPLLVARRP